MTLANLLSAEQILPDMKTTARWEAIGELVDVLGSAGKIRGVEREVVRESSKEREEARRSSRHSGAPPSALNLTLWTGSRSSLSCSSSFQRINFRLTFGRWLPLRNF